VGILAASQQFHHEVLIALPPLLLIMAAGSGLQYAMITYLGELCVRLETRINGLMGREVLTWANWYDPSRLPWVGGEFSRRVMNPLFVWQLVIAVPLGLIYIIAAASGGYMVITVMTGLRDPFDYFAATGWRWTAGSIYWTIHGLAMIVMLYLYFRSGGIIRRAMARVDIPQPTSPVPNDPQ
jgi:hypothetical protein